MSKTGFKVLQPSSHRRSKNIEILYLHTHDYLIMTYYYEENCRLIHMHMHGKRSQGNDTF